MDSPPPLQLSILPYLSVEFITYLISCHLESIGCTLACVALRWKPALKGYPRWVEKYLLPMDPSHSAPATPRFLLHTTPLLSAKKYW